MIAATTRMVKIYYYYMRQTTNISDLVFKIARINPLLPTLSGCAHGSARLVDYFSRERSEIISNLALTVVLFNLFLS